MENLSYEEFVKILSSDSGEEIENTLINEYPEFYDKYLSE